MSMSNIFAYEQGELTEEEVIELFQSLVDNGLVWHLQGHYGRTALQLISAGLVTPRSAKNDTASTSND